MTGLSLLASLCFLSAGLFLFPLNFFKTTGFLNSIWTPHYGVFYFPNFSLFLSPLPNPSPPLPPHPHASLPLRNTCIKAGFQHYDLFFEDCTIPPDPITDEFLRIVESQVRDTD